VVEFLAQQARAAPKAEGQATEGDCLHAEKRRRQRVRNAKLLGKLLAVLREPPRRYAWHQARDDAAAHPVVAAGGLRDVSCTSTIGPIRMRGDLPCSGIMNYNQNRNVHATRYEALTGCQASRAEDAQASPCAPRSTEHIVRSVVPVSCHPLCFKLRLLSTTREVVGDAGNSRRRFAFDSDALALALVAAAWLLKLRLLGGPESGLGGRDRGSRGAAPLCHA